MVRRAGAIGRIALLPKRTHKVNAIEEGKVNVYAAFLMFASGQLLLLR